MITGNINNTIITTDTFEVSGSTTAINLVVVDSDNLDISECTLVTTEVIKTNPPIKYFDDCGCPINVCQKGSLRITIKKIEPEGPKCEISEFTLDDSGLVLFVVNSNNTFFTAPECCESLGFTSEINSSNGLSQCRWQEIEIDPCSGFVVLGESDGFVHFQTSDGSSTTYVPSIECCPTNSVPEVSNFGYRCLIIKENDSCSDYTPSGSLDNDGYVLFYYIDEDTTSSTVPSIECCSIFDYKPIQLNGLIYCSPCKSYDSYEFNSLGIAVFVDYNGETFEAVPSGNCCPTLTSPVPVTVQSGSQPNSQDISKPFGATVVTKCKNIFFDECSIFTPTEELDDNGFLIFDKISGSRTIYVPTSECCPTKTTAILTRSGYACRPNPSIDICRHLSVISIVPGNVNQTDNSISVSGEYCDGENFTRTLSSELSPDAGTLTNLQIERCVKESSLVIIGDDPSRVEYIFSNTIVCGPNNTVRATLEPNTGFEIEGCDTQRIRVTGDVGSKVEFKTIISNNGLSGLTNVITINGVSQSESISTYRSFIIPSNGYFVIVWTVCANNTNGVGDVCVPVSAILDIKYNNITIGDFEANACN